MAITDPTAIPARISNGYDWTDNIMVSSIQAARVALWANNAGSPAGTILLNNLFILADTPSLPSGVTAYIPVEFSANSTVSATQYLICEKINLGSHDTATNTFTDGDAMPTRTVFNTTTQLSSPIYAEYTTTPGGSSRTVTVTYVDQDGNSAESTAAHTIVGGPTTYCGATVALNAGDYAAQDITAVSSTGTTPSGTIQFWGLIPIAFVNVTPSSTISTTFDFLNSGIIRRLGASKKLDIFGFNSVLTVGVAGHIRYVGDN